MRFYPGQNQCCCNTVIDGFKETNDTNRVAANRRKSNIYIKGRNTSDISRYIHVVSGDEPKRSCWICSKHQKNDYSNYSLGTAIKQPDW